MEQFSDNYLETPLAKNLDFFKSNLEDNWRGHYSEATLEIMCDAYCVGISKMWVENNLNSNKYIEIYKQIIIKCRSLECKASQQQDSAWEEQLKMMRKHYQIQLLQLLTVTIREYCMEA